MTSLAMSALLLLVRSAKRTPPFTTTTEFGRGDPVLPLRWTTKSTRKLAEELTRQSHRICADVVGDLMRDEGFSLQSNAKTLEGKRHPDRGAQFRYLNYQAAPTRTAGRQ